MSDDSNKGYLTKNNFHKLFAQTDNDEVMLAGYLWAIATVMPEFKRIAETAEDFTELRKQILDFTNQHLELNNDIEDDKENDGKRYGVTPHWRI